MEFFHRIVLLTAIVTVCVSHGNGQHSVQLCQSSEESGRTFIINTSDIDNNQVDACVCTFSWTGYNWTECSVRVIVDGSNHLYQAFRSTFSIEYIAPYFSFGGKLVSKWQHVPVREEISEHPVFTLSCHVETFMNCTTVDEWYLPPAPVPNEVYFCERFHGVANTLNISIEDDSLAEKNCSCTITPVIAECSTIEVHVEGQFEKIYRYRENTLTVELFQRELFIQSRRLWGGDTVQSLLVQCYPETTRLSDPIPLDVSCGVIQAKIPTSPSTIKTNFVTMSSTEKTPKSSTQIFGLEKSDDGESSNNSTDKSSNLHWILTVTILAIALVVTLAVLGVAKFRKRKRNISQRSVERRTMDENDRHTGSHLAAANYHNRIYNDRYFTDKDAREHAQEENSHEYAEVDDVMGNDAHRPSRDLVVYETPLMLGCGAKENPDLTYTENREFWDLEGYEKPITNQYKIETTSGSKPDRNNHYLTPI